MEVSKYLVPTKVALCCIYSMGKYRLTHHSWQSKCFKCKSLLLDPPYVITESTSLTNLEEEKDSVTMRCMSESNPPAKVWWEKEGVNGVFSPDREITISPVTRSTAGTYKCVAQNALGMSEPAFVQLDVKCKCLKNNQASQNGKH